MLAFTPNNSLSLITLSSFPGKLNPALIFPLNTETDSFTILLTRFTYSVIMICCPLKLSKEKGSDTSNSN